MYLAHMKPRPVIPVATADTQTVQRSKRLVFRVPHYKSGEELAAEVARARAAGK